MARAKVVLINSGMNEMINSAGVVGFLASTMAPVLSTAVAGAPVASGAYKASLRLEMTTSAALGIKFKAGGSRPVAVVLSDSPYAMSVEASTGNLTRSMNAAGGA